MALGPRTVGFDLEVGDILRENRGLYVRYSHISWGALGGPTWNLQVCRSNLSPNGKHLKEAAEAEE